MKKIKLTQGKYALVDNRDYEYLNQWKWCAQKGTGSRTYYAKRQGRRGNELVTIYMHRIVAKLKGLKRSIDHVSQNGLDNRRDNLRNATHKQNMENRPLFRNNTSGCRGVYWNKQHRKWKAIIQHNNKQIFLGYFSARNDAVNARRKAEKKYFTHA